MLMTTANWASFLTLCTPAFQNYCHNGSCMLSGLQVSKQPTKPYLNSKPMTFSSKSFGLLAGKVFPGSVLIRVHDFHAVCCIGMYTKIKRSIVHRQVIRIACFEECIAFSCQFEIASVPLLAAMSNSTFYVSTHCLVLL